MYSFLRHSLTYVPASGGRGSADRPPTAHGLTVNKGKYKQKNRERMLRRSTPKPFANTMLGWLHGFKPSGFPLSKRDINNTADLVNLQRVVLNQESEHGSTSWRALVSASLPVTAHLKGTNILIPKPTGKVCLLLFFTWGPSLWLAHLYITSWIFLRELLLVYFSHPNNIIIYETFKGFLSSLMKWPPPQTKCSWDSKFSWQLQLTTDAQDEGQVGSLRWSAIFLCSPPLSSLSSVFS